jgi:hypothetical protein
MLHVLSLFYRRADFGLGPFFAQVFTSGSKLRRRKSVKGGELEDDAAALLSCPDIR